jgi:3-hydroxy-D-aspartate aldolase
MLGDVAAMERHLARFMQLFEGAGVSVRPPTKTVKNPLLAQRLIAAGARGVCVA